MKKEGPPIPFSELIPEQRKVLTDFVSIYTGRIISMKASGDSVATTEINRFPGGGVRITYGDRPPVYEIKVGRAPFRRVDLDR